MESETLNGMAVQSPEDRLVESRQRYCEAITAAIDAELERYALPTQRLELLHDAAQFVCFIAAIKCAETMTARGTNIGHREALKQWWPIGKRLKREVPGMLLEFGREAEGKRVLGSGQ